MTREEAKEKVFLHEDMRVIIQARDDMIPEVDMCHILRKDVLKHIDKIYDDLKSRTCENCTYFIDSYVGSIPVKDCASMLVNYPPKDFGCSKFEKIEL